jgi:hypothetical protein
VRERYRQQIEPGPPLGITTAEAKVDEDLTPILQENHKEMGGIGGEDPVLPFC